MLLGFKTQLKANNKQKTLFECIRREGESQAGEKHFN
jgi:hypothetical protein